jgi:hypothetical protein
MIIMPTHMAIVLLQDLRGQEFGELVLEQSE